MIKTSDIKRINESFILKKEEERKDFTKTNPKYINARISEACSKENVQAIQKMLFHPKFKDFVDIHYLNDIFLFSAAHNRDNVLDIFKYLLTSPELTEHANIYARDGAIIAELTVWNRTEVLEYLVFDYQIEERDCILKILEQFPNKPMENMFAARKLKQELTENKSTPKVVSKI